MVIVIVTTNTTTKIPKESKPMDNVYLKYTGSAYRIVNSLAAI